MVNDDAEMIGEHGTRVPGYDAAFGDRLKWIVEKIGTQKRAGAIADVKPEMIAKYIAGRAKPSFYAVVALADAAGVSLDWLSTGALPRERGTQSSLADGTPLDLEKLEAATSLIEEWLEVHRRTMKPKKKAEVIAAAYEILIERTESTSDDSVRNNVIRLLRVAS